MTVHPPRAILLINEKNDRTFTRIYRVAAFFGISTIHAVDCPAQLRGPVQPPRPVSGRTLG